MDRILGGSGPARTRAAALFALALALALSGCSRRKDRESPGGNDAPPLRWHTFLEMALREGQRDGKNVMAVFYVRDCPRCKAMDDSVFTRPEVRKVAADLVTVRLDMQADSLDAARFRVRDHPTSLVLHADGSEVDRIVGFDPAGFATDLQNILAGRQTLDDLLARESEHANDMRYLLQVAQKLEVRGRAEEALARLQAIEERDPQNAQGATDEALIFRGRIFLDEGRLEESIVPFADLIERFPGNNLVPDARLHRAMALLGLRGRGQEGVDEMRALVQEYPGTPIAEWADRQLRILSEAPSR